MYLSLLILPLMSAIVCGLIGRKLGVTGSHVLSCMCLSVAAVLSTLAFYEVAMCGSSVYVFVSNWVDSEILVVDWAFWFDSLTVAILIIVLTVSSLVHLFSISYIEKDPHNQRFFSYLSLFTFFMLILVAADNYLVIFVGWEGIGISSYLLISFWTTRVQANKAAIQALLLNRIGDMFLTISFFVIFWVCGSLDYATVFSLAPFLNETALTIVGFLFLIAASGKSAQIFLHSWLVNAIEGPTPVSSLIHAATLVTSGVYLLIRSSPLLEYTPTALLAIVWVGAFTSFIAATMAIVQSDLKRTIAYSTISQIGYLFIACGLSQYSVALFHLCGHAYFKALLFLAAGGVLHSISDQQDIRRLGGLVNLLPFTYTVMLIGSISLCAFPYLTGFYSKDLIIELGYGSYNISGSIVYILGSITAILTAFYSFRLISLTFFSYPNSLRTSYEDLHEQPTIIIIPLVVLAIFSLFFGYLAKDLFVGAGSDFVSSSLFTHWEHNALIESEFSIPNFYRLLPITGTFVGALLGIKMYHKWSWLTVGFSNHKKPGVLSKGWSDKGIIKTYRLLLGKYYYDILFNRYLVLLGISIGLATSKLLDRGAIELIGPFGLSEVLYKGSTEMSQMDSGIVTDYSLYITIAIMILSLYLFTPLLFGFQQGDIKTLILYCLVSLSLVR